MLPQQRTAAFQNTQGMMTGHAPSPRIPPHGRIIIHDAVLRHCRQLALVILAAALFGKGASVNHWRGISEQVQGCFTETVTLH